MAQRRKVSSKVSSAVVEYILRSANFTQDQLAEALEVSAAYISRVLSGERSLTIDHLTALESLMQIPLGVLLLAAVPLPKPRPETKKLHELAREALAQADGAAKSLATRKHTSPR